MGYRYSDIFILAPSVRSPKTPIRLLANCLTQKNIPIHVPASDDEKIDEEVLDGKIVFSTFHQVKGLERKVILVYNFDNSYFKYKRDQNPYICPNELYVAITRSLEQLSLLHHYSNEYLPFLKRDNLSAYCEVVQERKMFLLKDKNSTNNNVDVTELVKYLPSVVVEDCLDMIKYSVVDRKKKKKIKIPHKTEQKDTIEAVSEINGIAIPAWFEYKTTGKINFFSKVVDNVSVDPDDDYDFIDENKSSDDEIEEEVITLDNDSLTCKQLLKISNDWISVKTGYNFKKIQISDYNWLNESVLNKCAKRLMNLEISSDAVYEVLIKVQGREELCGKKITGYIDCVDNNRVFEFKCVDKIDEAHILQLAIYMYMVKTGYPDKEFEYYLYNVLDDTLIEVSGDYASLRQMMQFLITAKYNKAGLVDDDTFIEQNNKIKNSYK